ncbi:DMT family transporter [Legionella israelensis]|uniref:DMT family transporter n=1 Tax=Legionella israelensis TaxID=454 RepID=A0AAX1EDU0_9GAMM|nr:DMT family transporter [Legionella israelensis]QBR83022.1 DMT family transporter [Legionella israelensis]
MKKNYFIIGAVFLVLAQTMVGVNIVTSKLLLSSIPVLILLEIRFLLATLVLLLLHWANPFSRKNSLRTHFSELARRDWFFIFAQALSAGVLFNGLMLTGLNYTDANVAGIITSALPAIIAILSWLILHEKISAEKALCVFFATMGLVIISYDKLNGVGASHSFWGDSIVLLALLPEASYYVLCKLYKNRLPLFLTSALLNGINAILLLPLLFLVPWEPANINMVTWFILFIIGLSSGFFYVFWLIGAKHVDGIMASLSTAIMPIATVILAWIILGEGLTPLELAGMGLVLFSIVLYAKR